MSSDSSTSALCQACALCCDGTIFDRVQLGEAEVQWAKRHRLPLFERDGATFMRQPCAALSSEPASTARACGVYDERPTRCSEFRCRLLGRVRAGEIEMTEAHKIIERTVRAVRALERSVGAPFATEEMGKKLEEAATAATPSAPTAGHTLLQLGVVRALITREFRPTPSKGSGDSGTPAPSS